MAGVFAGLTSKILGSVGAETMGGLGASMMSTGTSMASNFAGSSVGQGFGTALGAGLAGGVAGGLINVMSGNGPIQRRRKAAAAAGQMQQGGCSCSTKPKYTCEQKCAYGRYMGQKCAGCRTSKYKKSYTGYRKSYSSGSYPTTYSSPMGYRSAYKPRVAGRQARRTARVQGRQNRRTQRQGARQARRAARRN